jgi:tRNA(fMet)-specific endonuclease VapC
VKLAEEKLLLDTNILVHLLRGRRAAEQLESTYSLGQRSPRPAISVISKGEIKSLAQQFEWGTDKLEKIDSLLAAMPSIDITARVIHDAYAKFDHSTLQRGTQLGKNDLWIAASAYVTDSTLLTTDGDFEPLLDLGLRVERIPPHALK